MTNINDKLSKLKKIFIKYDKNHIYESKYYENFQTQFFTNIIWKYIKNFIINTKYSICHFIIYLINKEKEIQDKDNLINYFLNYYQLKTEYHVVNNMDFDYKNSKNYSITTNDAI